jgi:hypothetical protein
MAWLRAAEFDWKAAEREFHGALQLDPESDEARSIYVNIERGGVFDPSS